MHCHISQAATTTYLAVDLLAQPFSLAQLLLMIHRYLRMHSCLCEEDDSLQGVSTVTYTTVVVQPVTWQVCHDRMHRTILSYSFSSSCTTSIRCIIFSKMSSTTLCEHTPGHVKQHTDLGNQEWLHMMDNRCLVLAVSFLQAQGPWDVVHVCQPSSILAMPSLGAYKSMQVC